MTETLFPADILAFWRDAGPTRWFGKDAAFDDAIRHRFLATWEAARDGKLEHWQDSDDGRWYYCNGSSWVESPDNRLPQAIVDAAAAQRSSVHDAICCTDNSSSDAGALGAGRRNVAGS